MTALYSAADTANLGLHSRDQAGGCGRSAVSEQATSPSPAFTEIPPDDRGYPEMTFYTTSDGRVYDCGYPGMTRYTAPDNRKFACMGVGEDVRKALVERAEKKDG